MSERYDNPYRWDGHNPRHPIRRQELLKRVSTMIRQGNAGYLVGCRGMGKSVFLRHLKEELKEFEDDILYFPTAPENDERRDRGKATSKMVIDALISRCEESGMPPEFISRLRRQRKSSDMLTRVIEADLERRRRESPQRPLILIFDELDSYAPFGRPFFNKLEYIRKESDGGLVIFGAGGVGVLALDTVLSSSFFSRLSPEILEPFGRAELQDLAEPFAMRGNPLSDELLDTLYLLSGGNPALATYGLQRLWDEPAPDVLSDAFRKFKQKNDNFITDIRLPIFNARQSRVPLEAWRTLQKNHGTVQSEVLWDSAKLAARESNLEKPISKQWVFRMLRATGLIRCSDDAYNADLVDVEIIPSIFTLRDDVLNEDVKLEQKSSVREQLLYDLCEVLGRMHGMSPDFSRSEEGTLSSVIAMGLEGRRWMHVEREAQRGAGRTDIKASHRHFGDAQIIIEAKWWDNQDKSQIHEQVTGYWTVGVEAMATVMFSKVLYENWPAEAHKVCFAKYGPSVQQLPVQEPITAHFVVPVQPPKDKVIAVDHLLLRFAARKSSSQKPSK